MSIGSNLTDWPDDLDLLRLRLCQLAPGFSRVFQEPSVTRVIVRPSAVVTFSFASRPAGLGDVLFTSTRIVFSAPGLSWADTSVERGRSQPPVPGPPLITRLPLIVNRKKSSPVAISSAFSIFASGKRSDVTKSR